jgi:SAM-dependent methyltransferase
VSNNIKKLKSHYDKYIYPKPCENIEEKYIKDNRYLECDPNYHWHKLWPEKKYEREKLNILVAGCGSDQAAILAKCNPIHNFIGIDISTASLAHQKKLIKKHKIKNLTLICDDFRNVKISEKFNYIISTGVIHHLDDPGSALNFFEKNLTDDGVLYLMVYGDQQTEGIKGLKNIFKKLEFEQNSSSIKSIKLLIEKLKKDHPATIFSKYFKDINEDTGIIDTFLHTKEKFYSIKELIFSLCENNLIIKNFVNGCVAALSKHFVDNEDIEKKIRNLPIEEQLEISQILNWKDRKIDIICTKKDNIKYSKVYTQFELDSLYICRFQFIDYQINSQNIKVVDNKNETFFELNFLNTKINWNEILLGKKNLKQLTNNFSAIEKKNFYKRISFMIENYVLDFSFHEIENYEKYYAK